MRFSDILRFISFDELILLYPTLHEADITKLYTTANEIITRKWPKTQLRRFRETAELTQAQLAKEAGVSLRSIQMYEQRNKDINKAQVLSIAKIARVLKCDIEDLIEKIV